VLEKVQRKIRGIKGDEMVGDWREIHNDIHKLFSSTDIIRVIRLKNDETGRRMKHTRERQ
jgi:hypothetical protein